MLRGKGVGRAPANGIIGGPAAVICRASHSKETCKLFADGNVGRDAAHAVAPLDHIEGLVEDYVEREKRAELFKRE